MNLYGAINHFFFFGEGKKVRVFRTFDEIGSESYWRSSAYEGTFMATRQHWSVDGDRVTTHRSVNM